LNWRIVVAGRPSLGYARAGIAEYLGRLKAATKVEEHFLKVTPDLHKRMLEKSEGCFRIMLDERGRQFSSLGLADELAKLENRSISKCALLVAGAEGWGEAMRGRADLLWSLGLHTLQHELALVVALEQIYRAEMIRAGSPYHREG
jgi:23S rRNA (pseudouridine1915-N3)-methyltransferase